MPKGAIQIICDTFLLFVLGLNLFYEFDKLVFWKPSFAFKQEFKPPEPTKISV
jgi:hypothetical protein